MSSARTKVPETATLGEIIQIKALASHPMESGHRFNQEGRRVPRNILRRFECTFNGDTVFACELFPAISANPYFEFYARVMESGTFEFRWYDTNDVVFNAQNSVVVS